ncbi:hypothetical protein M0R45_006394 [Rubus argutus]|uniref:Uncharacterized protein n=1 Tax=Rubus argutus TaxID=59490 RepID=A0AAW1YQF3_RUBAR
MMRAATSAAVGWTAAARKSWALRRFGEHGLRRDNGYKGRLQRLCDLRSPSRIEEQQQHRLDLEMGTTAETYELGAAWG